MKIKVLLFISMLFSVLVFSQTKEDVDKIIKNYDFEKIKELEVSYKKKEEAEKKAAYEAAKINGWPVIIEKEDGTFQELMKLTPDGYPVYYSTNNVAAARSTRTNFLNTGGGLGLSLDGQNMVARVWDGGTARRTHNGFSGRVTTVDDISGTSYSSHATHVTGTILALPWDLTSANVKGMATQATARTFNWDNDESEALSEVLEGMTISNHSYGVPIGSGTSVLPAWYIGAYTVSARNWDEITYLAPYYLPVMSAGNDGLNNNNSNPIFIGFDKLTGNKTSKNTLIVANAQDANIATDGSLISVSINSGSSQGPTDDRRIKPDITGNGTGVTSVISTNNTATDTYSGTSMSSPNVAGTLLLLQQHYKNLTNSFMKSATLRGLACHTADDSGAVGPDPRFGWGLLNAKKAVETISENGISSWISENKLLQGETFTMTITSEGGVNNPLIASITWTDLPGTANNGTLGDNNSTPVLVNDLDIRIIKDGITTFYPWRLQSNPSSLAVRDGDNFVDNIEVIKIDNPIAGDYVISVTHKGTLVTGFQNFSLIVTGIKSSFGIISKSDDVELCSNETATYTFDYKETRFAGTTNFSPVGIPAGANYNISPTSLSANGTVTLTVSNLPAVTPGEYNVGIVGNNGLETEIRTKTLKIYSSTFAPVVINSPSNGFNGTATTVTLRWQANSNVENQIVQVSTSPTFASYVVNQSTSNTSYIVSGLSQDTMYYWRIVPSNRCGAENENSATVYSFRTGILSCGNVFSATDFSDAVLADVANSSASVPLTISGGLTIGEMRVSFDMTHTYVQDMTITLQGPASIGSPVVTLLQEACGDNDDISCRFVDSGSSPACTGIPAISGDIAPFSPLSELNGLAADGTWMLLVDDPYNGDGGTITNFTIEICAVTASLSSSDNVFNSLSVFPNPAKGIVNIDLAGSVSGDTTFELFDIQGRKVISKVSSNNFETLNVENLSEGVYMLSIQNGTNKTTKKVLINK
ncbi:S8 family serine peptidase [Flavobacterium sp.]|uniref:S8 family serine peptidase n=2 Tax=Flavobacterium sp. TaxID=239 RepID=UPI004048166C